MNFDIFPQLFLNGIIAGSFYALLAVGLALIYGVMNIQNFAHGALAVLGAYFFWTFHNELAWHVIPSLIISLPLTVLIGLILEYTLFLKIKDSNPLVSLVSTLGVGLIIKNLTLMIFSSRTRSVALSVQTNIFLDGKIAITNNQIIIIMLSSILMVALFIFLKKTKTGRTIRAVADNKELSAVLGVDISKVITVVVILSTLLAGIAGIMAAYDQNLHPQMSTFLNIKAFAAVILGGLGSVPGAIIGAYIIGFAENILIGIPLAGLYLPSSAKDAIAFAVLISILYFRPFGILGISKAESTKH